MLYKWYIYRYENDSKILENQYVIQITKKKKIQIIIFTQKIHKTS